MTHDKLLRRIFELTNILTETAMYARRAEGFSEELLQNEIYKSINIKLNELADEAVSCGYRLAIENRISVSDLSCLGLEPAERVLN